MMVQYYPGMRKKHIKRSVLKIFPIIIILLSLSCGSNVVFEPYNGFNFGITKSQAKKIAKKRKLSFNYKLMAYNKLFGNNVGTVYLIFENKNKLNAYDVRFYPYKQKPEVARETVFQLRKLLNEKYGKGKNVTRAHNNFSTLYSIWDLKNVTILLGVSEKDYKTLPKLIIIEKNN